MTEVNNYFYGEKMQCLMGLGMALISLAMAVSFLIFFRTDFLKGMAYPFLFIPTILLVICLGIVLRTSKDINRVNGYYEHQPALIQTQEIPRMEKVLKSFKIVKIVEVCLAVLGLGFLIFASTKPIFRGAGLGLFIQAALMYIFDYFVHERGKIYWDFLQTSP